VRPAPLSPFSMVSHCGCAVAVDSILQRRRIVQVHAAGIRLLDGRAYPKRALTVQWISRRRQCAACRT
jgi:hypothetical protein